MKDENKKETYFAKLKGFRKAVPIIFGALAIFTALCVFSQNAGFLGTEAGKILRGLFSYGSYLLPFLLGIHAICYAVDVDKHRFVPRLFFSLTAMVLASAIEYAVCFWGSDAVFAPVEFYTNAANGGFVGGVLGFAVMKLLGEVGVIVFSAAILAIYAIFFYADRTGEFGQKALDIAGVTFGFLAKKENDVKKKIADKKNEKAERVEEEYRSKSDELLNDQFFTSSGIDDLQIDQLGIGKKEPEQPEAVPEDPTPVRKRRDPSKPIDLEYGIEKSAPEKSEEPIVEAEAPKDEVKNSGDIYGIDDSAEKVFTQDFDPFNFATGEKIASKPSSKATIEEKLDDMTMLELRGEPTDKEKRMMELEKRKKIWLERNKKNDAPKTESPAPQSAPAPAEAPIIKAVETAPASVAAPTVSAKIPVVETVASPAPSTTPDVPNEVNAYTSYSTTQTTYTQPVKTVEFTINGNAAPSQAEPKAVSETAKAAENPDSTDRSTEDVAIFIAEKIARANPAYARSANEMRTYMRVTPSPEDLTVSNDPSTEISFVSEIPENTQEGATVLPESAENASEAFSLKADSGIIADATVSNDEATDGLAPEEAYVPIAEAAEPINEIVFDGEGAQDSSPNKASYERAASFISGMTAPEAISEPAPEFKPYAPARVTEINQPTESTFPEETLKVERAMFSPSAEIVTESAREVSVNDAFSAPIPAPAPELVNSPAPAPMPEPIRTPAPAPTPEPIPVPASAPLTENVITFEEKESTPQYTVVDEDTAWTEESDAPVTAIGEQKINWESDEEIQSTESAEIGVSSALDFSEEEDEDSHDESEEDAEPIPTSFDMMPEEDNVDTEEIPPEEQNPDVIKMREMFPCLNPIGETPAKKEEPATATVEAEAPTASETAAESTTEISAEEDDAPPFDGAVIKESPSSAALVPMEEVKKEEAKSKKPDYSNYEFPSMDLLAKDDGATDENIQAEIQENADKLIETLASFGVTASIKGVDRGPRITRYEVVPAKGVKVSSILNLQDDIALNLAAGSIRMEAPIPGKSAVGIEIPNKKSSTVRLRNLLETEDFQSFKSKTAVCIGRDVAGQPVFGDISKMPHLLIAGATGMGKSVCINSLMISILYKARPDEVKFIMIDPKQVEFTMYNGIPHLLVPVVSDAKQAAGALMWAVEEMEKRYNLLNPLCVRNIEAYNEKVTADPSLGEPMSKIVIVIDEFADLMLQVKDPVETLVMRIAQKARAAGIYLVIGTQRPSVNVITGVIKANVPSRISCKVMSNVDSKTVLDSAGAEKLLDRGDMLYAPAGSPKPHRVQGAFVADGEVESIMAHLKKFSDGSNYDSNVMEEIERAAQKCSKKGGGNNSDYDDGGDEIHGEGYLNDRQFLDAVEVAVNTRKISTSLIQRKLSIGYGKAAKFIDTMEDMGIVGEANGQRPREVLITPDEWREKLARATLD